MKLIINKKNPNHYSIIATLLNIGYIYNYYNKMKNNKNFIKSLNSSYK